MGDAARKTALRMIPYGVYVVTARSQDGKVAGAAVNWVTQSSFDPPLLVLALRADSTLAQVVTQAGHLALNLLGRDQAEVAYTFFRPVTHDEERISGERYRLGETGAPLLDTAPASVEAKLLERIARGDHHVFLVEVVAVTLRKDPDGRADAASLRLSDLGEHVFYGG